MARSKYKRLTDLYVTGTTVALQDGTPLWLQVLNPYERDEAIHDAQVARSRLIMALRAAGEERLKVEAKFSEIGQDKAIAEIAELKSNAKLPDIVNDVRNDPDWRDRIEILDRTDEENAAKPLETAEAELLVKIHAEYLEEVLRREREERAWLVESMGRLDEAAMLDEYLDMWLEKRGGIVAQAEYLLTEIWYGTRVCEAVKTDDGWDHSACNGHPERIWETKSEVRQLPESLMDLLANAVADLTMSVREAKNSARQGSSSDSSPLPSAPAESMPSTPTETPASAPGTSPPQLVTH